jgi:hypothetical protein
VPIFYLNFFVLLLTFIPVIVEKYFSISLPIGIEILFLSSLLVTTLLEKLYAGLLVQIILGIFFGIIGIPMMYILYYNSREEFSKKLIVLFSFSFSVSVGALWEVFRYTLYNISVYTLGDFDTAYAPRGLIFTIVGAAIVSIIGYVDMAYIDGRAFKKIISPFIRKNPDMFFDYEKSPEFLQGLINQGESEQVEFKSTLRTNLFTKKHDRDIELSALKTITAFLNSDGGTLLVGVSDDGTFIGIEKDGFQNKDQFYRHFSNLLKYQIGNQYRPFIKSTLIPIHGCHILKIDCKQCTEPVFLKVDNTEEFFIRTGPASVKLGGRKLLEYVNEKFK